MGIVVKLMVKKSGIKKDGTVTIYICVRLNNIDRMYNTGKTIPFVAFDQEKGKIKSNYDGALRLNTLLSREVQKIEDIILALELEGRKVTHDLIDERYTGKVNDGLISFCERNLETVKGSISKKHYEEMTFHVRHLKTWCGEVNIHSTNRTWVEAYEQYLIKKGLATNSISVYLRTIRKMYNDAIRLGITKNYPFKGFRIKNEEAMKEYLSLEEVNRLEALFYSKDIKPKLRNTLFYFLVGCFTGLRMQDCRNIAYIPVIDGVLKYQTQKKKKPVYIPLSQRAVRLLAHIPDQGLKIKNARIGDDLKEIMQLIGVERHITFHCSRHTFATISLNLGINLEVVSELLGHNSIKTTQIYAKIVNERKTEMMKRWDF